MGNDVVYDDGGRNLALLQTGYTQRIALQKQPACFPPLSVISALGGVLTGVKCAMLFAIHFMGQVRTARMATGPGWFSWHGTTSQHQQTAMVVHGIGVRVFHRSVHRHDQGNCAVHLLGAFFLVDLHIASRVGADECVVHVPSEDRIIPMMPKLKRVGAYARVSSGKDAMLHSLSAQVSYYSNLIQRNPDWKYMGVYAEM